MCPYEEIKLIKTTNFFQREFDKTCQRFKNIKDPNNK